MSVIRKDPGANLPWQPALCSRPFPLPPRRPPRRSSGEFHTRRENFAEKLCRLVSTSMDFNSPSGSRTVRSVTVNESVSVDGSRVSKRSRTFSTTLTSPRAPICSSKAIFASFCKASSGEIQSDSVGPEIPLLRQDDAAVLPLEDFEQVLAAQGMEHGDNREAPDRIPIRIRNRSGLPPGPGSTVRRRQQRSLPAPGHPGVGSPSPRDSSVSR